MAGELPYFVGVAAQAVGDAGKRPAETGARFDGHHPMGDLGKDVSGSETGQLLALDAFDQVGGSRPITSMKGKVIDERVGIEENGIAVHQVGECHWSSWGSSSGSVMKRSRVSRSPGQWSSPEVRSAQVLPVSTVTRTA